MVNSKALPLLFLPAVSRNMPWLAATLCGVLAAQPLMYGELSWLVDGELHLMRLAQLHELFRQGIVYSRWAPDMAYGFGYPVFNFYAPLVYYLAMPLVLVDVPHLLPMCTP